MIKLNLCLLETIKEAIKRNQEYIICYYRRISRMYKVKNCKVKENRARHYVQDRCTSVCVFLPRVRPESDKLPDKLSKCGMGVDVKYRCHQDLF